jgi:peptidoglycan/LPS O-acetylase OafA/YrhL
MKQNLSRSDTALLKGVAIAAIVLHNFCHWLPGCALENEYTFHTKNTWQLLHLLGSGEHVVLNLFSYFGHYGVPVFLFLSGYGLVKKYEAAGAPRVSVARFAGYHALKLWRLLALGFLVWLVLALTGAGGNRLAPWPDVTGLLTFTVNFFPQPHLHQIEGPWWFFSLIMQLYVFYRIFLYRRGMVPLAVWVLLAVALQMAVLTWGDARQEWLNYLRYNFAGSLLPFAAGIAMARYGLKCTPLVAAVSVLIVLLGCFNACVWTVAPLFVALSVLPLTAIGGRVRQALEWTGRLSAIVFVVHPLVRQFFIGWAREASMPYLPLLLYVAVTLLAALIYRVATSRLPRPRL